MTIEGEQGVFWGWRFFSFFFRYESLFQNLIFQGHISFFHLVSRVPNFPPIKNESCMLILLSIKASWKFAMNRVFCSVQRVNVCHMICNVHFMKCKVGETQKCHFADEQVSNMLNKCHSKDPETNKFLFHILSWGFGQARLLKHPFCKERKL